MRILKKERQSGLRLTTQVPYFYCCSYRILKFIGIALITLTDVSHVLYHVHGPYLYHVPCHPNHVLCPVHVAFHF